MISPWSHDFTGPTSTTSTRRQLELYLIEFAYVTYLPRAERPLAGRTGSYWLIVLKQSRTAHTRARLGSWIHSNCPRGRLWATPQMVSTYLVYTFWKPKKWVLELICIVDVVRNREHDCCGVPTHNPILIIGTLPQKSQIYKHQTFVGLCCYRPHQTLMKVRFIVEGGSGPGDRGSGSLPSLALGPWENVLFEWYGHSFFASPFPLQNKLPQHLFSLVNFGQHTGPKPCLSYSNNTT